MLIQGPDRVYRSARLSQFSWLEHGFGCRRSEEWPGDYTSVKQIHSDVVVIADGQRGSIGKGDALVTSEPGNLIGVRTADCVPILVVEPNARVVAAIHAGWRGTVANICGNTVRQLAVAFHAQPESLIATIGPSIGPCCFEVGPEVAEQFRLAFPDRHDLRKIDLPEANRRQLVAAGVRPENIELSGLCTMCDPEQFESYRRDRERAGRMVSAIGIRKT